MDYEKIASAAHSIDCAIRDNVALNSIATDTDSAISGDSISETRQSIQNFLDAPLGDKIEKTTKKAFAAAMVLAKERGFYPTLPETGEAIAAVVDEGMTRVKTSYQVGAGIIETERAVDHIIDRATSRAIAWVDQAFDGVGKFASESMVKVAYNNPLGLILGPLAESYQPVIEKVIGKVTAPAREAIKIGVQKVGTVAKSLAHKTLDTAKSYVGKVRSKVLSWF